MAKTGRQRLGRIIIISGIVIVLGSLANRIRYVIFPLALAIIFAGIFWERFSQTRFWGWLIASKGIVCLFGLQDKPSTKNNCQAKDGRHDAPNTNPDTTKNTQDRNDKPNENYLSRTHITPPKGKL
ncbi:MAG: hypothetical protein H8E40_04805 [Chloroflexi bacterium]|nr:hypothetical protein [Chloroflexota bacterium]